MNCSFLFGSRSYHAGVGVDARVGAVLLRGLANDRFEFAGRVVGCGNGSVRWTALPEYQRCSRMWAARCRMMASGVAQAAWALLPGAPLVVQANPANPGGEGWLLLPRPEVGQVAVGTTDIEKGGWKPIGWITKPVYNESLDVIRHGTIFVLTTGGHAALRRRVNLVALVVKSPPSKTYYTVDEEFDLTGLIVSASYIDGIKGEAISEGYGGYSVSGFDAQMPGKQTVIVSYLVVDVIKTAIFQAEVASYQPTLAN